MSAYEVTDRFLEEADKYDVVIMNLANGDMVGHTGNYDAAVKAVEVVDECLGKIYNKVLEMNSTLMVIGMVLVVNPEDKDQVLSMFDSLGEKAYVIGRVTDKEGVDIQLK